MMAGDLFRGTLQLLWHALRLPAFTFLAIRVAWGSDGTVLQVLRRAALSLCPHGRHVGRGRIDAGRLLRATALVW
jgi:hypothetical protein